jgi:hypothetical protein
MVRDSAGNHDGRIHGTSWTEEGKDGSALEFDGEEDILTIPASKDLNTAAHDEALHAAATERPTEVLVERRAELQRRASDANAKANRRSEAAERVEQFRKHVADAKAKVIAVEGLGRKGRKEMPEAIRHYERMSESLATQERRLGDLPRADERDAIMADLSTVERVLAERREAQIIASCLAPPRYIVQELGERPTDLVRRKSWERGVAQIESYRQEHGVTDKGRALGVQPKGPGERAVQKAVQAQIQRTQRELGLRQARARKAERGWRSGCRNGGATGNWRVDWSGACKRLPRARSRLLLRQRQRRNGPRLCWQPRRANSRRELDRRRQIRIGLGIRRRRRHRHDPRLLGT